MTIERYSWIGPLPSSWPVKPLKHVTSHVSRGRAPDYCEDDLEEAIPVLNQACVHWQGIVFGNAKRQRTASAHGARGRLRPGDLLVNSTGTGTLGRAAVFESGEETVADAHLTIVRTRPDLSPRFLRYVLQTEVYQGYLVSVLSAGATNQIELPASGLRDTPVPSPDRTAQDRIVEFLDRQTAAIDDVIAKKERVVALLQEKRQALITTAVTKGLDSTAMVKHSGFDWIGDVPAHWHVSRVKHVARVESGHTPSRSVPEHWVDTNDIPWVSLNDTKWLASHDYITDTTYAINELGLQNSSARMLPARVVVFTRDATIGKAAVTTRPMAVSQHIIAWVCGPKILPEYLLRVFYAMEPALDQYTFGATLKTIGMDDVRELVTPVPPLDEQKRIVDAVVDGCKRVDATIAAIQLQVSRLREYRQALISASVTGQIDVLKYAAA